MIKAGHEVLIETNAGLGSGFTDEAYKEVGAEIAVTSAEAWGGEMVIKGKEPLAEEYKFFREDLTLFTFLHLAAEPKLTQELVDKKVASIAYETVQEADGSRNFYEYLVTSIHLPSDQLLQNNIKMFKLKMIPIQLTG